MSKPFRPHGSLPEYPDGTVQSIVIERSPAVVEVPSLRMTFDFTFLFHVTSVSLASKVAVVLGKDFSKFTRGTASHRLGFFEKLVQHAVQNEELHAALRAGGNSNRVGDRVSWEACLDSWFRLGLETYGPSRLTTFGEMVNGLRRVCKTLERNGLAPRMTFPKMPKNYHIGRGTRPSLIEVKKREDMFVDVIQLVKERAIELGVSDEALDIDFLRELGDRVPPELIGSRDAFMTAMREVNTELLDKVRHFAEEAFLQGYEDFQEGRRCIPAANAGDVARLNELISAFKSGTSFRDVRTELSKLLLEKEADATLAVLLNYFEKHNNGVPFIGMGDHEKVAEFFVRKVYRHVGGVRHLVRLLGCDPHTIAAAMLIYMVDSGANASVTAELTFDCMQPTEDPRKFVIDSLKGRSDWQVIVKQFERDEPGVLASVPEVIEKTLEMTAKIRAGFPDLGPYLFIFRWFEIPSVASVEFLSNRLRYLVRDAGFPEGVYILERIRQSFLIEFTLQADGNKRLAEIVASHKKSNGGTINAYADRWPVRILLTRKIMEFQALLEYDFLFNGLDLEEAWGLTKAGAVRILKKAERTGYGVRCRNSKWGANPSSKRGEDCADAGAACLDCRARILVPDEESVRDIVRGKRILEAKQLMEEASAPRRWEAEGLPLLAFYIAAIEKLKRSPFAGLLKRILDEDKGASDEK